MKTAVKKAMNDKGVVFAVVAEKDSYEVWKLCENYDGQCRGGVRKTWRYLKQNMNRAEAFTLFNKRVGTH